MSHPVIILAPPHSFTSVVGTMLGQHPEMYGLPEVNLFVAETMKERARETWPRFHQHGLLRVVAELFMGEQTVQTIAQAQRWVNRRSNCTCVSIFQELAEKVSPRKVVDKSPRTTMHLEYIQRVHRAFPDAKFIHLLRHPSSHLESQMNRTSNYREKRRKGFVQNVAIRAPMTEAHVRHFNERSHSADCSIRMWYMRHIHILTFLEGVSAAQKMTVRGEDLLAEPDTYLRSIAKWLGLRTDEKAIDAMKHPEQSPYACIGPMNARFGNNRGFLQAPALRPYSPTNEEKSDRALNWRNDSLILSQEVRELAKEFGYI